MRKVESRSPSRTRKYNFLRSNSSERPLDDVAIINAFINPPNRGRNLQKHQPVQKERAGSDGNRKSQIDLPVVQIHDGNSSKNRSRTRSTEKYSSRDSSVENQLKLKRRFSTVRKKTGDQSNKLDYSDITETDVDSDEMTLNVKDSQNRKRNKSPRVVEEWKEERKRRQQMVKKRQAKESEGESSKLDVFQLRENKSENLDVPLRKKENSNEKKREKAGNDSPKQSLTDKKQKVKKYSESNESGEGDDNDSNSHGRSEDENATLSRNKQTRKRSVNTESPNKEEGGLFSKIKKKFTKSKKKRSDESESDKSINADDVTSNDDELDDDSDESDKDVGISDRQEETQERKRFQSDFKAPEKSNNSSNISSSYYNPYLSNAKKYNHVPESNTSLNKFGYGYQIQQYPMKGTLQQRDSLRNKTGRGRANVTKRISSAPVNYQYSNQYRPVGEYYNKDQPNIDLSNQYSEISNISFPYQQEERNVEVFSPQYQQNNLNIETYGLQERNEVLYEFQNEAYQMNGALPQLQKPALNLENYGQPGFSNSMSYEQQIYTPSAESSYSYRNQANPEENKYQAPFSSKVISSKIYRNTSNIPSTSKPYNPWLNRRPKINSGNTHAQQMSIRDETTYGYSETDESYSNYTYRENNTSGLQPVNNTNLSSYDNSQFPPQGVYEAQNQYSHVNSQDLRIQSQSQYLPQEINESLCPIQNRPQANNEYEGYNEHFELMQATEKLNSQIQYSSAGNNESQAYGQVDALQSKQREIYMLMDNGHEKYFERTSAESQTRPPPQLYSQNSPQQLNLPYPYPNRTPDEFNVSEIFPQNKNASVSSLYSVEEENGKCASYSSLNEMNSDYGNQNQQKKKTPNIERKTQEYSTIDTVPFPTANYQQPKINNSNGNRYTQNNHLLEKPPIVPVFKNEKIPPLHYSKSSENEQSYNSQNGPYQQSNSNEYKDQTQYLTAHWNVPNDQKQMPILQPENTVSHNKEKLGEQRFAEEWKKEISREASSNLNNNVIQRTISNSNADDIINKEQEQHPEKSEKNSFHLHNTNRRKSMEELPARMPESLFEQTKEEKPNQSKNIEQKLNYVSVKPDNLKDIPSKRPFQERGMYEPTEIRQDLNRSTFPDDSRISRKLKEDSHVERNVKDKPEPLRNTTNRESSFVEGNKTESKRTSNTVNDSDRTNQPNHPAKDKFKEDEKKGIISDTFRKFSKFTQSLMTNSSKDKSDIENKPLSDKSSGRSVEIDEKIRTDPRRNSYYSTSTISLPDTSPQRNGTSDNKQRGTQVPNVRNENVPQLPTERRSKERQTEKVYKEKSVERMKKVVKSEENPSRENYEEKFRQQQLSSKEQKEKSDFDKRTEKFSNEKSASTGKPSEKFRKGQSEESVSNGNSKINNEKIQRKSNIEIPTGKATYRNSEKWKEQFSKDKPMKEIDSERFAENSSSEKLTGKVNSRRTIGKVMNGKPNEIFTSMKPPLPRPKSQHLEVQSRGRKEESNASSNKKTSKTPFAITMSNNHITIGSTASTTSQTSEEPSAFPRITITFDKSQPSIQIDGYKGESTNNEEYPYNSSNQQIATSEIMYPQQRMNAINHPGHYEVPSVYAQPITQTAHPYQQYMYPTRPVPVALPYNNYVEQSPYIRNDFYYTRPVDPYYEHCSAMGQQSRPLPLQTETPFRIQSDFPSEIRCPAERSTRLHNKTCRQKNLVKRNRVKQYVHECLKSYSPKPEKSNRETCTDNEESEDMNALQSKESRSKSEFNVWPDRSHSSLADGNNDDYTCEVKVKPTDSGNCEVEVESNSRSDTSVHSKNESFDVTSFSNPGDYSDLPTTDNEDN